ncbi:MAG: xanthine phosphoribosyltransferase [Clostridia bacterium]|nr:xanthine phosphoribosyltransferase [Clostridia bacterium]
MQALKDRILKDGQGIGTEILKVDSFLNHQIDTALMEEIGKELAKRFDGRGITKILTVESSGIPVAYATALAMGHLPVLFAKKASPTTMVEGVYRSDVKSFTKETVSTIRVSRQFLNPQDVVLVVDDFLAYGEAALGLAKLVRVSGATLAGIGIVIEKQFQGGGAKLKEAGCTVESLVVIKSIQDNNIEFA